MQCIGCKTSFKPKRYNSKFCNNLCKSKFYSKIYYHKYREKVLIAKKSYYETNKVEIIAKTSKYCNERRKVDINFRLKRYLRSRLYSATKHGYLAGSAIDNLGCSIFDFKIYLTSKFISGMTWDNYGEWHIDHIKPLSSFNLSNPEEIKLACHYTNLQPLWAKDNLSKGNR